MSPPAFFVRLRRRWGQRPDFSERQAGMFGVLVVCAFCWPAAATPAPELTVPAAGLLALVFARPLLRSHAPRRPALTGPLVPGTVYVQDTGTARGRGVYAARDIAAGELIERCPVTVFDSVESLPAPIESLMFNWATDENGVTVRHALAHGTASLFNHASPSNLRWDRDFRNEEVRFFALTDIAQGTELTINYNNGATGLNTPDGYDWFGNKGIPEL